MSFQKISKRAIMNSMKIHGGTAQEINEDEISVIEQEVVKTKEFKTKEKEKEIVQKSLSKVKEQYRVKNLQPMKQEIIKLSEKR